MNKWQSYRTAGITVSIPVSGMISSGKTEYLKPNVICILLDDFGYSDSSCYGSRFYQGIQPS